MEKQYLNEYITNSSHIASKEYFYDITGFYEYLQIRYPDNDPEESIVQCTGSDAIAFINDQFNNNLSNNTINRKLSSLKSFYNYLNYTYNIGNPFLNIKSLHSHKTVCSLTLDDCSNLLKTINGINKYRDLSIMYLFLTCGLTVSEVINLKLDDLKDGSLYIYNKNGYLKIIEIPDALKSILRRFIEIERYSYSTNYFFSGNKKKEISKRTIHQILEKCFTKSGLEIENSTSEKLRYSGAKYLENNYADKYFIDNIYLTKASSYKYAANNIIIIKKDILEKNPIFSIKID